MSQNVQNNWLYGCMRCITYGASRNVTMVGSYNCSAINTSGLVAINCSAMVFDSRHSGWTVDQNKRVLKNGWTTITSSMATALAPYSLTGDAGNKYKIDLSGGHVYLQLGLFDLEGAEVILKVITAGNDLILATDTGAGSFDANATPYTISAPAQYAKYRLSSDGTNFHIT